VNDVDKAVSLANVGAANSEEKYLRGLQHETEAFDRKATDPAGNETGFIPNPRLFTSAWFTQPFKGGAFGVGFVFFRMGSVGIFSLVTGCSDGLLSSFRWENCNGICLNFPKKCFGLLFLFLSTWFPLQHGPWCLFGPMLGVVLGLWSSLDYLREGYAAYREDLRSVEAPAYAQTSHAMSSLRNTDYSILEDLGSVEAPAYAKTSLAMSSLRNSQQTPFLSTASSTLNSQGAECCAMCLEEFGKDEQLQRLECGHHFHKACLGSWLGSGSQNCPLCRRAVRCEDTNRYEDNNPRPR
jgi:hypothetical protein